MSVLSHRIIKLRTDNPGDRKNDQISIQNETNRKYTIRVDTINTIDTSQCPRHISKIHQHQYINAKKMCK